MTATYFLSVQMDHDSQVLLGIFHTSRVGQNHIYTVYIRYFWQRNHQIYGHLRCIYTVLANPTYFLSVKQQSDTLARTFRRRAKLHASSCTSHNLQHVPCQLRKALSPLDNCLCHGYGWPKPYVYTIYDRKFGYFPAKIPYMHRKYIWHWPTLVINRTTIKRTHNTCTPAAPPVPAPTPTPTCAPACAPTPHHARTHLLIPTPTHPQIHMPIPPQPSKFKPTSTFS